MNCKPGDLAMVVGAVCWVENRTTGRRAPLPHLGTVVRVASPVAGTSGQAWWLDEPVHYKTVFANGSSFACEVASVPDRILRPIRPHGVTDDEVRELYAPTMPEHA